MSSYVNSAASDAAASNVRLERAPHLMHTRFDDGALLLDIESGNFIELNRTAAVLWDMIAAPTTLSELVTALTERFDVAGEQCVAQVEEWTSAMRERGLILVDGR